MKLSSQDMGWFLHPFVVFKPILPNITALLHQLTVFKRLLKPTTNAQEKARFLELRFNILGGGWVACFMHDYLLGNGCGRRRPGNYQNTFQPCRAMGLSQGMVDCESIESFFVGLWNSKIKVGKHHENRMVFRSKVKAMCFYTVFS